MASKKVFITGATGYIGGSILNKIVELYKDLEITALLRAPSDAFASRYPQVNVVKGTFYDHDVIEKASEQAEIIIHCGKVDYDGCINAILAGLRKRSSKSLLIHLSGTGVISDEREQSWQGDKNPHVWDDIKHVQELYDLPPEARHRPTDKLIQDASNDLIKTICIFPPDIYGQSTSIGGHGTYMVPLFIEASRRFGETFYLGKGENIRGVAHIDDVTSLFTLIIGKYLDGGDGLVYGKEGFYFAVTGEVSWKDAAQAINRVGQEQGWLPNGTRNVSWTKEQVEAVDPNMPDLMLYIWGSNSRASSSRAKKLGWTPRAPSFWDALSEDCRVAAEGTLSTKF